MTEPQPNYSAYREASFGHASFDIKNRTHAYYSWHRNEDGYAVEADSMWFFNRYWHPVDESSSSSWKTWAFFIYLFFFPFCYLNGINRCESVLCSTLFPLNPSIICIFPLYSDFKACGFYDSERKKGPTVKFEPRKRTNNINGRSI